MTGLTSASLRYSAWFDTERGWDYAYVAASTDGGRTWKALPAAHTSDYDPVGAAYGPGYTGESDGWIQEEVDLSALVGQEVMLRFEYVTDDATNLTGFAVDNVEVPELGFRDAADSAGDWKAQGFRRVEGPLRQRFIVQVIENDDPSGVRRLELDSQNRAQVRLEGPATLVISGATGQTAEAATYTWSVTGG